MLDKYLQTEQAREDVRVAVHAMATSKTSTFCGGLEDHWIESTHLEAWLRVAYFRFGGKDFLVSAYYRPDGDRYVVTDLGEGVRALRIRTGAKYIDILQKCRRTTRHNHFYGAFGQIYDATIGAGNWERGSGIGALFDASTEADKANLPDAICRVMLASLRVAQS